MNTTNVSETVPSSRDFTRVGITYGLYGVGLFLIWPALIGVVVAYVTRRDVPQLLSSHCRWLINTFWWWFIAWSVIVGAMLAVIIPNALEIESTIKTGSLSIPWEFMGAVVFGGLGWVIVWLWVVYRLVRGAILLSDGRAGP